MHSSYLPPHLPDKIPAGAICPRAKIDARRRALSAILRGPLPTVPNQRLDTTRRIATPEGIELQLRLAGPVARTFARLIDVAVALAILITASTIFSALGGIGFAAIAIISFLTVWLLPAWCEVYWQGATPGKHAMKLKVVLDDGRPVDWGPALVRNLLWVIDFLPVFFAAGLFSMMINRDFKRLGDLAAGTIVIHIGENLGPARITSTDARPPTRALTLTEQRTVIDFAERADAFTEDRAIELAEIAAPILDGARGASARNRLTQIANHYAGRRAAQ
jgi:uncharacterized RDD family membrane protein YckC